MNDRNPENMIRTELEDTAHEFRLLVHRALALWAVRWSIGFAIIWAITAWTGQHGWLWTFGIVVAALSLGFTVLAQWLMSRRLARTRTGFERLDEMLKEDDRL